jgi:ATP-binding cassette subfamily C (CFTR/MRP) protein 1
MSLHTKTQLLEMIYRKSLRVSGAVKAALGVGPIVNLQSNDAAKLWTMPTYLHMVWNGPFQVCDGAWSSLFCCYVCVFCL